MAGLEDEEATRLVSHDPKNPIYGMYMPMRRDSGWFSSDWADAWLEREDRWAFKIYEIAQFNPILTRQIRRECTKLEIAHAWKTLKALSDFAMNDGDA